MLILTSAGILLFNPASGQYTPKFLELNRIIQSIKGERSILLDSEGLLWIGYKKGVVRYSPETKTIDYIKTRNPGKTSIIVEGQNDIYWISTFGDGLLKYNDRTKQVKKFKHDPNNPATIKDDYLNCIYKDNSGKIWLGSNGALIRKVKLLKTITSN